MKFSYWNTTIKLSEVVCFALHFLIHLSSPVVSCYWAPFFSSTLSMVCILCFLNHIYNRNIFQTHYLNNSNPMYDNNFHNVVRNMRNHVGIVPILLLNLNSPQNIHCSSHHMPYSELYLIDKECHIYLLYHSILHSEHINRCSDPLSVVYIFHYFYVLHYCHCKVQVK